MVGRPVQCEVIVTLQPGIIYDSPSGLLRKQMRDLLHPKARVIEISSNGLHPERLLPIVKKHPTIKVRFSLEGDDITNNCIRGEKGGYATKVAGLRMLQEAGGQDLGFAFRSQQKWFDS